MPNKKFIFLFMVLQFCPSIFAWEKIQLSRYFYSVPTENNEESIQAKANSICTTHASQIPARALKWQTHEDLFTEVNCEPLSTTNNTYQKFAVLSADAISLYKKAEETGEFTVKALQRVFENTVQTVIVLGESHQKSKTAGELGKEFFKHFQAIGYEEIQLSFPEDAAGLKKLDGTRLSFHSKKYPPKLRYVNKATDVGSTIDDLIRNYEELLARQNPSIQWGVRIIDNYGKTRGKAPIMPKTIKLTDSGREVTNYSSFFVWGIDEPAKGFLKSLGYNENDIISEEIIHELVKKAANKVFTNIYQIVNLEAHSPPTPEVEQLVSAQRKAIRADIATVALAICTGLYGYYSGGLSQAVTYLLGSGVGGVIGGYSYANQLLDPVLPKCLKLEVDPLLIDPLIESRDPVLAKGIHNTFQLRPNLGSFLAIIGRTHADGVVNVLEKLYGFHRLNGFPANF